MFSLVIPIVIIVIVVVWLVNANKRKPKRASRAERLANIGATKGEVNMKDMMLEQMNADLEQSVQTDKTVIIIGIILNIILLGANTGVAAATNEPDAGMAINLIFFVLTAFIIILNVSVGYALLAGKKRRVKLTERLDKFWQDEGLGKYQDDSISKGYATRGNLFTFIIMALGGVALLIPLIMYLFG